MRPSKLASTRRSLNIKGLRKTDIREVADALVSIEKLEGVRLELEVGVQSFAGCY